MFQCSKCARGSIFGSGNLFISHYIMSHSKLIAKKEMICDFPNCLRKFDKLNSFRKHVLAHQSAYEKVHPPNSNPVFNVLESPLECDQSEVNVQIPEKPCSENQNQGHSSTEQYSPAISSVNFDNALMNAAFTFIASLYDCGSFTDSQIQYVIDAHTNLLGGGFLELLKQKSLNLLDKTCVLEDEKKNLARMFDSCSKIFEGFQTHYKRENELKNCGAYIPPEPFTIGFAEDEKNVDGAVVKVPIELQGQCIPLRKVLKGFLEIPGVFEEISMYVEHLENMVSLDDPLENIIQGDLWRSKIKPKFVEKFVLPLNFSFDDYESNKELGCHTGVHKLGAGYVNIPCIPPKFRSLLENYFLVVLFHSSDRARGNKAVFRKVVNEFKFLEEEGIEIVTLKGTFKVYFALCLVLGDNLGVNGILGFVECFTANFYCRVCFEVKNVTKYQTEANAAARRTIESYDNDLLINNCSLTGRKGKCVFNALLSYHVSENIHLDAMHDLDEGVWDYVMYQVVFYLYKKRRFTLDQLNEQLQCFHYGPNEERNKLPFISNDDLAKNKRLRFNANEMRCFVRYFGLMVGHLIVNEDLEVWNLYLTARRILDIVCAPAVFRMDVPILRQLIKNLLSDYIRIFGLHLQPKFHFLLHYPDLMILLGPLEPLSCYRMESKHKEGKNVATRSQNRVNLPFTIAKRHQLKLAFRLVSGRGFKPMFQYSSVSTLPASQLQGYSKFCHVVPPEFNGSWNIVKSLQINGAKYSTGSVVLLCLKQDNCPVFGRILHLNICSDQKAFLLLQLLEVVEFDRHCHAYQVREIQEWAFVNVTDLLYFAPSLLRSKNNKKYVTFRFAVHTLRRN